MKMKYELSEIIKILPPPKTPVGLDRPWSSVERELELALPLDYKEFIDAYGSGQIADSMSIWNFRDRAFFKDTLPAVLLGSGGIIPIYKHVRAMGNDVPYSLYPDKGGLLPFGSFNEVHNMNWITDGNPNSWSVVYWYSDGLEFIRLDGDGFGRFLLKLLRGQYTANELPRVGRTSLFKPSQYT